MDAVKVRLLGFVGSWSFPMITSGVFYVASRWSFMGWIGEAGFWWQLGWTAACGYMALWLWMILGVFLCTGCESGQQTNGMDHLE